MKKIKIVHIINNLGIGGAERVLLLILEELSKRDDVEITLVSLEGHGDLEKEFTKLPIKFKKFNYDLFGNCLRRFDPYFRARLYFFIKKLKPDIIHGHLIKGEDFAKVLGFLLKKPVVITSHDCYLRPGRKEKWLNRFVSRAVAVSPLVKEHLIKNYELPEEKIAIIPNGIKAADFKDANKKFDAEAPIFIYVGRLIEVKGVQEAIKALNNVKKDYPGLRFLVFGDGYYKDNLMQLAKKLGANFVEFKGKVSDVPAALIQGDIFILPSKSEGFSMATLEAAASGKAILATPTGSIPEMIIEGENGYFIKFNNTNETEKKIRTMLKEDIDGMGKKSQKIIGKRFDIAIVAKQHKDLYDSLSSNRDVA